MIRKIIISSLIFLTFVVVSIYVIVTAQGTKIDNNGNVVNTSILRINSNPKDVVVYINDQKAVLNNNRVEWLEPGDIKVTLKKSGYTSWEKTVSLQAGIIEDIYAQLYPESLDFTKITSLNVDKFFFSKNTDYIFYSVTKAKDSKDNGLWRLKLTRNLLDIGAIIPSKIYSYTSTDLTKLLLNEYEFSVSNDNLKAVLSIPKLEELYYLDFNNPTLTSLSDTLSFFPKRIDWMSNSNNIIVSDGHLLIYLDVNSKEQNLIYYSPVKEVVYSENGSTVYYYRNDKSKLYAFVNGQSSEITIDLNTKSEVTNILSPADNTSIIYILEGSNLHFFDLNIKFKSTLTDVSGIIATAPNGRYLVYLDKNSALKALTLKLSIDLKSYKTQVFDINIPLPMLEKLIYTFSSNNLLALLKNDDNTKSIWFLDSDGMNPIKLADKEEIIDDQIQILNNGTDIYTLIKDNNTTEKINNIYNLSIEEE